MSNKFSSIQVNEQLIELGFTSLESDVYLFLLIEGEGTGYAIGKGVNKAIANVYKALESLSKKGAITYANSGKKICMAVPWKQFLSSKKKEYLSNIDSLTAQLEHLPEQKENEQINQIINVNQVMEHSIQIIESAESILLLDLQPGSIEWFQPALTLAVERGVEVRAKVYEKINIPGVILTVRNNGREVFDKTDHTEFTICADGREFMLALISKDGQTVHQALQSKSSLMNMKIYSGLLYELVLTDVKRLVVERDLKSVECLLDETAHLHPFSAENIVFQEYKNRYKQKF